MAPKNKKRACVCGKILYKTERLALLAARKMGHYFGKPMAVYECRWGAGIWHLTKDGPNQLPTGKKTQLLGYLLVHHGSIGATDLLKSAGAFDAKNRRTMFRILERLETIGVVRLDRYSDARESILTVHCLNRTEAVRLMNLGWIDYHNQHPELGKMPWHATKQWADSDEEEDGR